jgi:hypothetical protein
LTSAVLSIGAAAADGRTAAAVFRASKAGNAGFVRLCTEDAETVRAETVLAEPVLADTVPAPPSAIATRLLAALFVLTELLRRPNSKSRLDRRRVSIPQLSFGTSAEK